MVHFDIWPEELELKNPKHVYAILPPIFSYKKEYLNLSSLKRRPQLPTEGEKTGKEDENLCHFGHDNMEFVEKHGHLSPVEENLKASLVLSGGCKH